MKRGGHGSRIGHGARSFPPSSGQFGRGFGMARLTRFISEKVKERFEMVGAAAPTGLTGAQNGARTKDVRERLKAMWS
jgi:hypothetical protein